MTAWKQPQHGAPLYFLFLILLDFNSVSLVFANSDLFAMSLNYSKIRFWYKLGFWTLVEEYCVLSCFFLTGSFMSHFVNGSNLECLFTDPSRHRFLEGSAAEAVACKCAAAGLSPGLQRRARPLITSCQRHAKEKIAQLNAQLYFFLKKKNAQLNTQLFFFAPQHRTQGRGRP